MIFAADKYEIKFSHQPDRAFENRSPGDFIRRRPGGFGDRLRLVHADRRRGSASTGRMTDAAWGLAATLPLVIGIVVDAPRPPRPAWAG